MASCAHECTFASGVARTLAASALAAVMVEAGLHNFPLRLVEHVSHHGPKAGYLSEAFATFLQAHDGAIHRTGIHYPAELYVEGEPLLTMIKGAPRLAQAAHTGLLLLPWDGAALSKENKRRFRRIYSIVVTGVRAVDTHVDGPVRGAITLHAGDVAIGPWFTECCPHTAPTGQVVASLCGLAGDPEANVDLSITVPLDVPLRVSIETRPGGPPVTFARAALQVTEERCGPSTLDYMRTSVRRGKVIDMSCQLGVHTLAPEPRDFVLQLKVCGVPLADAHQWWLVVGDDVPEWPGSRRVPVDCLRYDPVMGCFVLATGGICFFHEVRLGGGTVQVQRGTDADAGAPPPGSAQPYIVFTVRRLLLYTFAVPGSPTEDDDDNSD